MGGGVIGQIVSSSDELSYEDGDVGRLWDLRCEGRRFGVLERNGTLSESCSNFLWTRPVVRPSLIEWAGYPLVGPPVGGEVVR